MECAYEDVSVKKLLNVECARYECIQNILKSSNLELGNKQSYEMKNILERWLVSLSNFGANVQTLDPIFVHSDFMTPNRQLKCAITNKLYHEMLEKQIPKAFSRMISIIDKVCAYLDARSSFGDSQKWCAKFGETTLCIGSWVIPLSRNRKELLLEIHPSLYDLAVMIIRYHCLLPGGQQWSIPLEFCEFLVNNYNVTIEAFASPLNSKIIQVDKNLRFCSLFTDTDEKYGSIGNFFNGSLPLDTTIYCNPPFVESLMEKMTTKITHTCDITAIHNNHDTLSSIRFIIIVPRWEDATYYKALASSKYLVYSLDFAKGKHYFVNGEEKIRAMFASRLFVLSVGYKDVDYESIATFTSKLYS